MKFLLVGYFSIAQRRVVPALAEIARVEQIDIASISKVQDTGWKKAGRYFTGYAQTITESGAGTLYISLLSSWQVHQKTMPAKSSNRPQTFSITFLKPRLRPFTVATALHCTHV